MRRSIIQLVSFIVASSLVAACGEDSLVSTVSTRASVSIQDLCDSASFNAGLGAGSCTKAQGTTLQQFNTQLASQQFVTGWQFVPSQLSMRVGQAINAVNNGGETHTFTEVKAFGGGMVPALNAASGNPVEAPECVNLPTNDLIRPGQTFTTDFAVTAGTQLYQCCIHPWMRATVTVTG